MNDTLSSKFFDIVNNGKYIEGTMEISQFDEVPTWFNNEKFTRGGRVFDKYFAK